MIDLIFGVSTPVEVPSIQILTEQRIVVEAPPEIIEERELTIEEKIAQNYYGCNTDTHWISAENATCLLKQSRSTNTQVRTQNTPRAPQNGSNSPPAGWFPVNQCTWFVWTQRPVGHWNNASSWLWQAQRDGWATGSTPEVGAIAWESNHVSLVIAVNGNMVTVQEANYKGYGVISTRTAPASQFKYIY
jgi:surface antigen